MAGRDMAATERKLTIRLPEAPKLKAAKVHEILVEPGTRVAKGDPVMVLASGRRQHLVRAPKPGRAVPLLAAGDPVAPGEPLYVLNIDAEAMAEIERDRTALVPMATVNWRPPEGEAIAPSVRARRRSGRWSAFAGQWGRPILGIAVYALGCLAVLPVVNLLVRDAPLGALAALAAAAVLTGVLLFYLYAPASGVWPRRVVGYVSASWIGLAMMALFLHPSGKPNPAAERALAGLMADDGSGEAALPVPVHGSGVAVQLALGTAGQGPTLPKLALGPGPEAVSPHGVRIRPWRRVEPDRAAGAELAVASLDPATGLPALDTPPAIGAPAPAVPPLAHSFGAPVAAEGRVVVKAGAVVTGGSGLAEPVAEPALHRVAALSHPEIVEPARPEAGGIPAAPRGERLPAWLDGAALAVLEGAMTVAEPAMALPDVGRRAETGPSRPDLLRPVAALPDRRPRLPLPGAEEREPDPVIAATDPALLIFAALTQDRPVAGDTADRGPDGETPLRLVPGAAQERPKVPLPAVGEREPDPVAAPRLALFAAGGVSDEPSALPEPAAADPVPAIVARLALAAPAGTPGALPETPRLQPLAGPEARRLLFLYFDDPRLDRHPGLGDPWLPLLPPGLEGAILSSRVEGVHRIVHVAGWCAAAAGGEDRTARLSDRVRLLDVRVEVDPGRLSDVERALPVIAGGPPGFFHNRAPLLGGLADAALMAEARAFLTAMPGGAMDPNRPALDHGGLYYDSAAAAVADLERFGCRRAVWNDGAGPTSSAGRAVAVALGG